MNSVLKNTLVVLFFLALSALFFLPNLSSGSIPYAGDFSGSDLTELNLPFRFLAAQSIRQGQIPLWTDLLANGFPLLAEGQTGVFYPLNLILFTFLPLNTAVNLDLFFNFFLAALFAYIYFRILKISRVGSVLAALAFAFSGFFVFRIKHLNLINAAVWLPLELYLIEKYFVAKKKSLIIVFLSLIFAIQFFAGHPQISYISILTALFYFIFRFFSNNNFKTVKVTKAILAWLAIGILTFGLSAVQLLPTYELSLNSARGQTFTFKDSNKSNLPLPEFATFLNPYIFNNPAQSGHNQSNSDLGIFWENNFYFGLIPLVLSLVGLFFVFNKKKNARILYWLCIFCLFFILAKYNFLFKPLWFVIPGLKIFRFHQRFILPLILGLAAFSGFGFDFFKVKLTGLISGIKKSFDRKFLIFGFSLSLIIIVTIDLFYFGLGYVGSLAPDYFQKPASVEYLEQDKGTFRIISLGWQASWAKVYALSSGWFNNLNLYFEHRNLLQPNLNLFYGLAEADDRGWKEGGQMYFYLAQLWDKAYSGLLTVNQNNKSSFEMSDEFLKIASLQNVKYFLTFGNLAGSGIELKKELKQDYLSAIKIYENKYFLPRAFGVFSGKVIKDSNQALAEIFSPDFDPQKYLVLGSEPNTKIENSSSLPESASVEFINKNPLSQKFSIDFSQAGYLFFSQTAYPSWRVLVDGKPAELLRADYSFLAVPVPAGKHLVNFYFSSGIFLIGAIITIVSFLAAIILIVFALLKKSKPYDQQR